MYSWEVVGIASRRKIMRKRLLRAATLAWWLGSAMVSTHALAQDVDSPTATQTPAPTTGSMLPRNVVAPLNVINGLFPEVTREASTGRDSTATGHPRATRSVIYATADGSKKVTITVDQYETSRDALSAYQEAVQKSKIPGFKPLAAPNLGQQAFAGTVTMGAETHVGLGARDGKLIIGATLAGFDATPDNVAKLAALANAEGANAKMALSGRGAR
jgi:hypothetical protein